MNPCMSFCDCSGYSVHYVVGNYTKEKEKNKNEKNILYMALLNCLVLDDNENPVGFVEFDRLELLAKYMIEWCTDFMLYAKKYNNSEKYENLSQGKYIALWSFIYDYLKICKNSGYDYLLMEMLDHYRISDHGCGIRCSWFNDKKENPYADRSLDNNRKEKIEKWIDSMGLIDGEKHSITKEYKERSAQIYKWLENLPEDSWVCGNISMVGRIAFVKK